MRATKFRYVVPGFENVRKLNGVWVDRRFELMESSKHIHDDAYYAVARNVDFVKNREGINTWAYKNTNHLIKGTFEKKINAFRTLAHRFFHSEGNSVQMPLMTSNKKQNVSGVSKKEKSPQSRATNICIKMKSYDQPFLENWELPPHTKQIGLPESRVLYTVLRSPHIDKKSREQFEMRIKKMVIKTETNELRKKLFWLKRQRIFGAQCEILISCKTRLDKGKLERLL